MNRMTARQRYLYLSAKLYELAAEFTDSELVAMLREQSKDRSATDATIQAVRALLELHRSPSGENIPRIERDLIEQGSPSLPTSQQGSSLLALFEDGVEFPTVARIAALVGVPARTKEARNRYLARMVRRVDAMTKQERARFFGDMATRLNRQPESFIAKWSKVIKDT